MEIKLENRTAVPMPATSWGTRRGGVGLAQSPSGAAISQPGLLGEAQKICFLSLSAIFMQRKLLRKQPHWAGTGKKSRSVRSQPQRGVGIEDSQQGCP